MKSSSKSRRSVGRKRRSRSKRSRIKRSGIKRSRSKRSGIKRSRSKSHRYESSAPQPADPALYEKIKKKVKAEIPKHSAYRSGIIVTQYKQAFKKKHGRASPYLGKRPTSTGLSRWFKEEWRNQRGGVGYQKKGDVYRPTHRITKDTPKTFKELSAKEIREASKEKRKHGRIKRF